MHIAGNGNILTTILNTSLSLSLSFSLSFRYSDVRVHAVAFTLPEFWADNAHVWFAQTEAPFAVKNFLCSLTKFYYVLCCCSGPC